MTRAWHESADPVCVSVDTSPQLRDAITAIFPVEVEYYTTSDDLKVGGDDPSNPSYRCTVLWPREVRTYRPGVIGVDVWVSESDFDLLAQTYLFRWDGSQWAETTPDETGVTVTTTVS